MEHYNPKPVVIAHPDMGVASHIAEMHAQGTVDIIMIDSNEIKEIKSSHNLFMQEPYMINNTFQPELFNYPSSKRGPRFTPAKKKRKKKK